MGSICCCQCLFSRKIIPGNKMEIQSSVNQKVQVQSIQKEKHGIQNRIYVDQAQKLDLKLGKQQSYNSKAQLLSQYDFDSGLQVMLQDQSSQYQFSFNQENLLEEGTKKLRKKPNKNPISNKKPKEQVPQPPFMKSHQDEPHQAEDPLIKVLQSEPMQNRCDLSDKDMTNVSLNQFINCTDLILDNNRISFINIQNLPKIKILSIKNNKLQEIHLIKLINLEQILLDLNQLKTIDLQNIPQLSKLGLCKNKLKQISILSNVVLKSLDISFNELTSINLAQNNKLTTALISNNKLKEIVLSYNIHLEQIDLSNNQLEYISTQSNKQLQILKLSHNQLTQIELQHNRELQTLQLSYNLIKNINLSSNNKITHLSISNNKLVRINLDNLVELRQLKLAYNQLKTLNLKNNPKIQFLDLQGNELEKLQFKFLPKISGQNIKLSNQKSNQCQVVIACEANESTKCNKLKDALTRKYENEEKKKAENLQCRYIISMSNGN